MLYLLLRLIAICACGSPESPPAPSEAADLVVLNARITTLADPAEAQALAAKDGRFIAVGDNAAIEQLIGPETDVIDARNHRIISGLNDSHIHATRAGRFYNTELRWDGVDSLARGLDMIRLQALRTPSGQWVRVIGGWSPFQFKERRLPTPAELTEAAPDTPVFVLFLYSKGYLNRAGVQALGISAATEPPPGSRIELTPDGGAILHADPSPVILYRTVAALPSLSPEDQINSSIHFYRELNRFGITSVVDPGGGGHLFPTEYASSDHLAKTGELTVRVGMYLFAGDTGHELRQYQYWTQAERIGIARATAALHAYATQGAGENLTASAADYENFLAPRPELGPSMEQDLVPIVALLAEHHWPIRIHATYDESISRIVGVFERTNTHTPLPRIAIDHAETITAGSLDRLKALGGGIALQNRMAYAGEYFIERYGQAAAASAPPLRMLIESGVPLGAGTDATRVSGHNPWLCLHWLVSGRTLGGTILYPPENRLTRDEALRLYTVGSAWFTDEEQIKGRISPGQLADFTVLSADYFSIAEHEIPHIESLLTVLGGRPVYAAPPFTLQVATPELPPISPAWSPLRTFGGFRQGDAGR